MGGRQRRRGEASRASNPQPSRLSNIPAPRVYPHKTKGVMRSCFLAPPPFPSHCGASGGKIRRTLFYLSALFCPSPPASVREHHILHSIHTHTHTGCDFPKVRSTRADCLLILSRSSAVKSAYLRGGEGASPSPEAPLGICPSPDVSCH